MEPLPRAKYSAQCFLPYSLTDSSLQPQGTGTQMQMRGTERAAPSQHAQTIFRFPHPSSGHGLQHFERGPHTGETVVLNPENKFTIRRSPSISKQILHVFSCAVVFSPPGIVSLVLSSVLH